MRDHGRDHVTKIELALDAGEQLCLLVRTKETCMPLWALI